MAFNFLRRGQSHVSDTPSSYEEPQYQAEAVAYHEGPVSEETVYIKIIRVLLYATAFLVPLIFLPWTTGANEINKQMLLIITSGIGLILWLVNIVSVGRLSWRPNSMDLAVVSILGAAILSTIFSLAKFKSLFGTVGSSSTALVSMMALTAFYYLAVNTIDDKGKLLKKVVVVSVSLALLYGLLQMLGLYLFSGQFATRNFTSVGSLNALGVLAAICLPLFSKFKANDGYLKYLFLDKVGIIMSLVVLVILNWWILWTVAIAGMVALIVFENIRGIKFKMARFILPMTVIVLAVFLIVVNFNISGLKNNFPIEVAPSFNLSNKITLSALKDSLVFGYGPENFSLAFDKYGAKSLADTTLSSAKFVDSTSEVYNLVITGGVVGALAFLYLLWSFGWSVFKSRRQIHNDQSGETVAAVSMAVAAIVAMFLYSFNMALMMILFLALCLVALAFWGDFKRTYNVEDKAWLSMIASLGFIAGLIVVLIGVYYGVAIYVSDVKYAQALTVVNKTGANIQDAANKLAQAINWNSKDDRYFRAGSQVAMGLLSEELNRKVEKGEDQQARTAKIQNLWSSAVRLAQQATLISPKESSNWVNLGNTYQALIGLVDGTDALAIDAFTKATELRQGDSVNYVNIANVYTIKADLSVRIVQAGGAQAETARKSINESLAKAEEALRKAIEISPNYGLAIYNLGIIYDREGKTDEAIAQLEKVAPANTNQPGLYFELGLLYYRNNQKDKAISALQQATLLSPDYANARWYLGLIYEEKKNYDLAIEQMEKILAVEVNKDNQTVKTKLEELQKGRATVQKAIDQKPL
jgi:Flp pilus assembly protein TadD